MHKAVIPRFFQTKLRVPAQGSYTPMAKSWHLFEPLFGTLATPETFKQLNTQLMSIDISEELACMDSESLLEISMPVLGVTDLLGTFRSSKSMGYFPQVVGINGFGSARAEFIVITDIADNKYEITVDPTGKIELPLEGEGLFSIPANITFIYSESQIKQGKDVENLSALGMQPQKVYLLLPEGMCQNFQWHMCVTHIDEENKRHVDSIRFIEVMQENSTAKPIPLHPTVYRNESLLQVDVTDALSSAFLRYPSFTAMLTLEPSGIAYNLPLSSDWIQDTTFPNVFSKHFGVNENLLYFITKELYPEKSFLNGYLHKDNFELSTENGYNNFLLIPKALGCFYDLIIHNLVTQKISGDFLFKRISSENINNLDFSQLTSDLYHEVVLLQLQTKEYSKRLQNVRSLFFSKENKENEIFSFYTAGIDNLSDKNLPTATIEIKSVAPVQSLSEYNAFLPSGYWNKKRAKPQSDVKKSTKDIGRSSP